MITTNYTILKSLNRLLYTLAFLLVSAFGFSQTTPTATQDSTKTGFSLGTLNFPNPQSIISKYTYDPKTDRYIFASDFMIALAASLFLAMIWTSVHPEQASTTI